MNRRPAQGLVACAWVLAIFVTPAAAQETVAHRTTYGDIGLLDMPSARMAPNGELALAAGALDGTQRFTLSFQALPGVEGSFRYSHIADFQSPNQPLYDRSLGFKARLWHEDDILPEVSLGMRDFLGTGVYSSEYVVATKALGPVDLTGGMGWGRLASDNAIPNPLGKIISSFNHRGGREATGGTVNFGQFFHGSRAGLFGGAVWHTPVPTLDVLVEYSSDRYVEEVSGGAFRYHEPINVGVSYTPFAGFQATIGYLYGTSFGATISLAMDPTTEPVPQRIGPPIPEPVIRDDRQQQHAVAVLLQGHNGGNYLQSLPRIRAQAVSLELRQAALTDRDVRDIDIVNGTLMIDSAHARGTDQCARFARIAAMQDGVEAVAITDLEHGGAVRLCPVDQGLQRIAVGTIGRSQLALLKIKLRKDIAVQDLDLVSFTASASDATIYYRNTKYSKESQAAGRIARILMADLPPDVEIFHIVPVVDGMAMAEVRVIRSSLERGITAYSDASELTEGLQFTSAPEVNPVLSTDLNRTPPRLTWSLAPGLHTMFFDPTEPVQLQAYLQAGGSFAITPHWSVNAVYELNLVNNIDTSQSSNSALPHVRSDVVEYYKSGPSGVRDLDLDYTTRLAKDLYVDLRGGYLELMYAGVGGQVLWRPGNGRWAFGLDGYQVRQRDFQGYFGLRDYQTFTGHASIYYQSPWYGMNVAVHAGQYLAKDHGATFEVSRRFDSGIEVGSYATFTNVPFSKFGEGSFDKGIFLRIPFQWGLPIYTKSDYAFRLNSLTRDGGQRLSGDDSLYQRLIDTTDPELTRHANDIIQPEL